MRSQPKRGLAYSFGMALPSQSNPLIFQVSPTLAAGDVKVVKDGGTAVNIASLPTASGKLLWVTLTAAEMDADVITLIFSDVAGDEWCDVVAEIRTGSDPQILHSTTLGTVTNQTTMVLSNGSADDDAYNGCDIVLTDVSTPQQQSLRKIVDYVGSTRVATLDAAPAFTVVAGDYVDVLANRAATQTVADTILADTTELQADWVDGGRLDNILDARASQASVDTIDDLVDDLETRIGTPTNLGSGATVAANLADIESQTDDIGVAGAGLTALASATNLAVVAGYIDTEVAAIQTYLVNNLGTAGAAATEAGGTGDHLTAITVAGMSSGSITASSIASGALNGKGDWNVGKTGYTLTATTGLGNQTANITGTVSGNSTHSAADVVTALGTGSGLTSLAPAATALSTAIWTGTRAGYLDNLSGGAVMLANSTGSGLTSIPWNAAWDAEVQSEVADALVAYDPPTNTEMEARTLVAASYATASSLATVAAYLDTEITDILVTTNKLTTAMELDGGVYRFTTNALEQAPTGGNSPEAIAAAVRTELATELARVDVAIGSRHASGAAVASVTGDVAGKVLGGGSGTISGTGAMVAVASDGLDSVSITAPSGVASNFREMIVQVWRRFFKKATQTDSQIKTYADDGSTVVTTQTVSDDGTTETQGAAS